LEKKKNISILSCTEHLLAMYKTKVGVDFLFQVCAYTCICCLHVYWRGKKNRIFSSFNFWYYYVQWYWEKYIFACVWLREFMNWYWKIACIILPVVLKSEVEDMVVILLFSVLVILLAVFGFFPHYYFVTNMNTSYSRSSNVEVQ